MALLGAYGPNTELGLNQDLFRFYMVLGGIGTILTAGYFLWMLQRVNMGTVPERWQDRAFKDVLPIEWLAWTPLLILTLVLGLYPRLVFGVTEDGVAVLTRLLGSS
jgi:NADH-quinone oxidoreductase subunit M